MALLNTDTLDVAYRGGPAHGIINVSTNFLSSATLDIPYRGGPYLWYQEAGAGGGGGGSTPAVVTTMAPVIEGWIGQGKSAIFMQ